MSNKRIFVYFMVFVGIFSLDVYLDNKARVLSNRLLIVRIRIRENAPSDEEHDNYWGKLLRSPN